jgi:hypothetical protein
VRIASRAVAVAGPVKDQIRFGMRGGASRFWPAMANFRDSEQGIDLREGQITY